MNVLKVVSMLQTHGVNAPKISPVTALYLLVVRDTILIFEKKFL